MCRKDQGVQKILLLSCNGSGLEEVCLFVVQGARYTEAIRCRWTRRFSTAALTPGCLELSVLGGGQCLGLNRQRSGRRPGRAVGADGTRGFHGTRQLML